MRLKVGIIGAGIGGLALSSLLAARGHAVTLAERFATPVPLGSGLVVQPVGLAVLDALGAGDAARALGQPIARMVGHAGPRVVLDVSYRGGAQGLAMHRASLFAVLWQAATAAGIVFETGAPVTAAPVTTGKRQILRAGATSLGPFDLVVDASGASSVLSPLSARVLGFGAIWGQVPWPNDTTLPPDQLSQRYFRASKMAGILPIGQMPGDPTPRAAVFWSLPLADLAIWPQRNLAEWQAEVAAFWPEMSPFLAGIASTNAMTPARYTHGSLRQPCAPALAFIGDAAHRASPQLGQGANMALLDAMALALALDHLPLDEALPHYARIRRWHMRSYQAISAAFTPMYQSHSCLLPQIRDHIVGPLSRIWPVPALLTRLVSGDILPPLASTLWR
jgi:2-polyprenyl-6-methoxyphenol hydroxylase-like FAD-dependent oxidoreductase